jgi:hypothetical protein
MAAKAAFPGVFFSFAAMVLLIFVRQTCLVRFVLKLFLGFGLSTDLARNIFLKCRTINPKSTQIWCFWLHRQQDFSGI